MDIVETLVSYGISKEEVEKEIALLQQAIPDNIFSAERKQKAIENRLLSRYKRLVQNPAYEFEGVFFTDGGIIKVGEIRYKKAKEAYLENPVDAIAKGLVDKDGNPLEPKVTASGLMNPFAGQPLRGEGILRVLTGVAREKQKDGSYTKPFKFNLMLNKEETQGIKIPMFKLCVFQLSKKQTISADGIVHLAINPSVLLVPKIIEKQDFNIYELVKSTYQTVTFTPGDLLKEVQNNPIKYTKTEVLTEGTVSGIPDVRTKQGNRLVIVTDTSLGFEHSLMCYVPETFEIDFAPESEVVVIGRPSLMHPRTPSEAPAFIMNVTGLYAVPELKIEIKKDLKPIEKEELLSSILQEKVDQKGEVIKWD